MLLRNQVALELIQFYAAQSEVIRIFYGLLMKLRLRGDQSCPDMPYVSLGVKKLFVTWLLINLIELC